MAKEKDTKGITATKSEDFSEWYTQVIQKADLADYSSVSGCIIFKPASYAIWEKIQHVVDAKLKAMGVKNAYFPLFIPEKLLQKEATHVEGFTPEVAWVTEAGNSKLDERLAVRPTSETIMYESYAKWVRSYNDLPLRLNQWNNVVRWEFKHPVPFLRTREFLWNEGHTCFATREEAEAEVKQILSMYEEVLKEYFALPCFAGKKSEKEKFAGAVYTTSLELIMPNGRAIQGPDAHFDGQNFAKAFGIEFLDENGQKQYAWQNTWAISTRMLGVMFALHGDDKGLIIPPKLAPIQIVVIPILFEGTKTEVLRQAKAVYESLQKKGIAVHLDDRDNYTPGWKFNEWEVKGIPLRIEIGPRDVQQKRATVVRRDTGEKESVEVEEIVPRVHLLLDLIHEHLYTKAKTFFEQSVMPVGTIKEAEKQLQADKLIFAPWCGTVSCEDQFKEKTGARSLNSPFTQPKIKPGQSCFACKNTARHWFYFGKSY